MEFNYCSKTRIIFGRGKHKDAGIICKDYGDRCILIAPQASSFVQTTVDDIYYSLKDAGIEVKLIQSTKPNPSYEDTLENIEISKSFNPDFVVGLGGGSTLDTAKMIAYCCNLSEINEKELYNPAIDYSTITKDSHKVLPIIAMPTTAGTGSQCTQAAVITTPEGIKETIFRQSFFPTVAIVDSQLCDSMPARLSHCTGFDAFCHLSESYINNHLPPFADLMALYGIELIGKNLPQIKESANAENRDAMSLADTLGGICLSNGGATVPHMIGELVTSFFPNINHGASLALVYPYYVKYFFDSDKKDRIKTVLSKLGYNDISNGEEGYNAILDFLEQIDLKLKLTSFCTDEEVISNFKQKVMQINRFDSKIIEMLLSDLCK